VLHKQNEHLAFIQFNEHPGRSATSQHGVQLTFTCVMLRSSSKDNATFTTNHTFVLLPTPTYM